jgi:hypothetical protein
LNGAPEKYEADAGNAAVAEPTRTDCQSVYNPRGTNLYRPFVAPWLAAKAAG